MGSSRLFGREPDVVWVPHLRAFVLARLRRPGFRPTIPGLTRGEQGPVGAPAVGRPL